MDVNGNHAGASPAVASSHNYGAPTNSGGGRGSSVDLIARDRQGRRPLPSTGGGSADCADGVGASASAAAAAHVILIRPADESSKELLYSPELLCESLESPPFTRGKISDVRVNRRKGLVAVDFSHADASTLQQITGTTQLGSWNVSCSQPSSEKYCYGVISPVSASASLDALSRRVSVEGSARFLRLERLDRIVDQKKEPSLSLKVVFEGRDLPKRMKIGYHSYWIRPYESPPLQCYNCQRLHHTALGCTSPQRCLLCAGRHHFRDCQSTHLKCANCNGEHKANSSLCPVMPRRVERRQGGKLPVSGVHVSVGSAGVLHPSRVAPSCGWPQVGSRTTFGRSQGGSPQQVLQHVEVSADVHHRQHSQVSGCLSSPTYSQVAAANCSFPGFSPSPHSFLASAALPPESGSSGSPHSSSVDFLSKLTTCLVDLFSLSLHDESPSKTRSIISSAVQKHFGVVLPSSSLSRVVPDAVPCVADSDVADNLASEPEGVCSPGKDLVSCLGVDRFQLVSDSDASDDGQWTAVLDGPSSRSACAPSLIPVAGSSEISPSPVIGGTRRGRGRKCNAVKRLASQLDPIPGVSHGSEQGGPAAKKSSGSRVAVGRGRPPARGRSQKQ